MLYKQVRLSRDRRLMLAPDGADCVFVPYATRGILPGGCVNYVMPDRGWCQPCHMFSAFPPGPRYCYSSECDPSVKPYCACRPTRNGRPDVYGYWARVDL